MQNPLGFMRCRLNGHVTREMNENDDLVAIPFFREVTGWWNMSVSKNRGVSPQIIHFNTSTLQGVVFEP